MIRVAPAAAPLSAPWAAIVAIVVAALAGAPFLFAGAGALDLAALVCIFVVLAVGYDLLIGQAGIVSLAHGVFFGLGAYAVALATIHLGPGWASLAWGAAAGAVAAATLAGAIGAICLRSRPVALAMLTLAIAIAVPPLVAALPAFTGGAEGLAVALPRDLTPAYDFGAPPLPGLALEALPSVLAGADATILTGRQVPVTGRLAAYYLVFGAALVLVLATLWLADTPFGTVLRATRRNPLRAAAMGYAIGRYRLAALVFSAGIAALAGALFAIWNGAVRPETSFGFEIMLVVLLAVVIGGIGTLRGPILAVPTILVAGSHLPEALRRGAEAAADLPVLPQLLDPDRWLLWLGVMLVLGIHALPRGIAGGFGRGRGG